MSPQLKVRVMVALCVASVAGCANSSNNDLKAALAGSPDAPPQVEAASAQASKPPIAAKPLSSIGAPEAAKAADKLAAGATPGNSAYKIGPQDVLEISVFKVPELSKSVQVADSGTINLALVGDVPAAGRTAQDVERDLAKKLGTKYLRDPQVTVFVREYNSQRITVEGAVKKPGVFPFRGRSTLLQAVAMAEGLDVNSDTNVIVFRTMNGKRAAARFDIADIRGGRAADPQIESGDIIVVESSAMKETFSTFVKLLPLASVFALL